MENEEAGRISFDTNADGRPDFFVYRNALDRTDRIAYDRTGQGIPDYVIRLDEIPFDRCRHLVMILDGFGYDVVKRCYDAGGLRMFHPPSRLVAPYPSMTDIASADIFGDFACRASQSQYYDEVHNCSAGSATGYITYSNEAYARFLTYRQEKIWDGIAYLNADPVFQRELRKLGELFDKRNTKELIAHFASTAAVSTQGGEKGQADALKDVERFVNQLLWETHGLVKVTLLADHGHTNVKPELLDIEEYLTDLGWRPSSRLEDQNDVCIEHLGLVTMAAVSTKNPKRLAQDLSKCPGVEIVSYADQDSVVVLSADGGRAVIRKRGAGYSYETAVGDPLLLKSALAEVPANDGYYDDAALLLATATSEYPDALVRLWWAHFGQVENPPSVLASLKDCFCVGSGFLAAIAPMVSTHGSLNYKNSVSFIMSTAWAFPPVLRSRDVRTHMEAATGARWPRGK